SGFVYDYSTGNVGIGTAGPSFPLEVNGRIQATNIYNTASADFGFNFEIVAIWRTCSSPY
ncbi:hypothetical protein LCGC14_1503030, partial [marine sediment metagenome]